MKKLVYSLILVLLVSLVLPVNYAWAISNPDDIDFESQGTRRYRVFENVIETGDMLITAEGYVNYATPPTDYLASEAFIFELLNTGGNETLIAKPLQAYGNRPIGIYLSATQVTSLGLVSGTAYILRITGNPAIFASPTGNSVNATLGAEDYIDQSTSGNTTTSNHIRNFMILIANDMETEDAPATSYLTTSAGISYLSEDGGSLFLAGIPGLNTMCPSLFVASVEAITGDTPASTGSYALLLTPLARWGSIASDGLTTLGLYLGINQALAGGVVAMLLGLLLAIYVYKRLESGVATLMLIGTYPYVMAWLGLMPLALAFVAMMVIVILGGFFFLRQGAL